MANVFLYTGLPGASKTLNAIKFVDSDPQFKDRPVYYHNIKELTLDWNIIDREQLMDWPSLPDGSVVFIDEAQDIFPVRDSKTPVPPVISAMNTLRHRGFTFIIITQHPRLLDTAVRRLAGPHLHFERRYGRESSKVWTFGEVCDKLENRKFMVKDGDVDVENVKFDKNYYGVYKSAEIHNVKRALPKKLIAAFFVLPMILAGVVYAGFSVKDSMSGYTETDIQPVTSSQVSTPRLFGNEDSAYSELSAYLPRVPGMIWTAPRYDKLMKPKVVPKPSACMVNATKCTCYTEQATPLDVPDGLCLAIVEDGWFDDTREPDFYDGEAASESRTARAAASGDDLVALLSVDIPNEPDFDQWGRPSEVVSRPGQGYRSGHIPKPYRF